MHKMLLVSVQNEAVQGVDFMQQVFHRPKPEEARRKSVPSDQWQCNAVCEANSR